ncbi:translocation/assembly module TamB domain-containing protein [Parahaliea aestuarii]|uniref:Translocation and assembly module TamB C-terminal domain-containing protein n=1 Tax=Parahaliea aestuarii TaxID=1852021 RepID=A0A5C8ZRB8_9GAMM|nr:translocation/assembly module TamB domain-containing protein [Parahaliea aestuarii]TXS91018.1 hypothetical protein FVW59_12460 [Parahaliea aestuarii]
MKRVLALLPVLLVLLLVVLLALPLTDTGSRALLRMVERYTPLTFDYGGGSLYGRFQLHSVRLPAGDVLVELEGVEAAVKAACLVQGQLCFERLSARRIAVTVSASEEDSGDSDNAPDTTPLVFPLRILAPQIELAGLEVNWPGGSWVQDRTQLSAQVETTGIYVNGARIRGARLTLEPGDETDRSRVELPAIWLPFELAVDQLELVQSSWDLAGQEGQLARAGLQGRWVGPRLQIAGAALRHSDWGQADIAGELRFERDWPVDARASVVLNPELPGIAELQPGPLSLAASGDLGALVLSLEGTGARQLQVRGTVDTLDSDMAFDAEAQLSWQGELALSSLVALPQESPPVTLHSPLSLSVEGNLQQQTLLAGANASGLGYKGVALLLEGQWRGSELRLDSLSALEPGEQGSALLAKGRLQLDTAPSLALSISSPGLTLPSFSDYLFGRIQGELKLAATLADEGWALDLQNVELSGEVNGLPAKVRGVLGVDSERYLTSGQLDFDVNGARGLLRAATAQGGDSLVRLAVDDLSRWQRDSRGSLSASARLRPSLLAGDFEFAAEDVVWQGAGLEQGSASGRFNLQGEGSLQAEVLLRGLKQGDVLVHRSELAVEGRGASYRLYWQSKGDIEGTLAMTAQRTGGDWLRWRGELAATELQTPLGRWTLPQPVQLSLREGVFDVAPHCWQQSATELCLQQGRVGTTGEVALSLGGDAALLQQFASEGVRVSGRLDGELDASWTDSSPLQAHASLRLVDGEVSQQLEHSSASWRWDLLALDAQHVSGLTELSVRLQQQDVNVLGLDAAIDGNRDDALSGQLHIGNLQLAALRPFIPELARLEGSLSGELALSGTASQPDTRGRLHWQQGALRLHENPTELEQLDLRLDLQGQRMQLAGGGLLGGGDVTLQGNLQGLPDWSMTLDVKGRGNRLLYPPSLEVVVSPDLQLSARADLVTVAGEIQVEEGRLEQDQLPEGSVELSSDVVRVDYAGKEIDEQQAFATQIDLRLAIAERFRVLGSGLDARVGGDLEVRQRPGRPLQLYGNLNVVDGEFRAYGQHLNIRQGRVSFAGAPENPELELRAERDISLEQVTAGVRVGGTLDAPTLLVYSDPPMSQSEALSYLVRGRGLDAGADADGTALALSLGSGILNRSALVEGINRLPGLSQVEFGAEGSADETAATVSGYLGERIYLSYGVGLYEPVNVLTARLYLYTRLWLEVVSRLESSVDLYYSFDIE